jgi:hypothetical protein
MIRTITTCDKSVRARPAKAIVVGVATNADVLENVTQKPTEFAHRSIQNVGANPCHVVFGEDAADDQLNFHKVLASGQELDCSFCTLRVNVFSRLGTTVAVLLLTREDMTTHNTIVGGPAAY